MCPITVSQKISSLLIKCWHMLSVPLFSERTHKGFHNNLPSFSHFCLANCPQTAIENTYFHSVYVFSGSFCCLYHLTYFKKRNYSNDGTFHVLSFFRPQDKIAIIKKDGYSGVLLVWKDIFFFVLYIKNKVLGVSKKKSSKCIKTEKILARLLVVNVGLEAVQLQKERGRKNLFPSFWREREILRLCWLGSFIIIIIFKFIFWPVSKWFLSLKFLRGRLYCVWFCSLRYFWPSKLLFKIDWRRLEKLIVIYDKIYFSYKWHDKS